MADTKRIVIIADMHCGHRAGLTPPQYRHAAGDDHIWQKYTRVAEEAWGLYAEEARRLVPIDCLVVNGDAIDGRGEKSGGCEALTVDRNEQCKIAIECIKLWEAPKIYMTRGTPYHAGDIESWEDSVAEKVGAKIGDHEWVDVNGYIFDVKHFVGGSQIPHGRYTAVARDALWNSLWAEALDQPRADMIVRSHVHYCITGSNWSGEKHREFLVTPALQAMGTRFGAQRMSGIVTWGLVAFDIDTEGRIAWRHYGIHRLDATRATASRV